MCGPPDFDALQTCVTRVAELSAAGLTFYAVHRTIRLIGEWKKEKAEQPGARREPAVPILMAEVEHSGR